MREHIPRRAPNARVRHRLGASPFWRDTSATSPYTATESNIRAPETVFFVTTVTAKSLPLCEGPATTYSTQEVPMAHVAFADSSAYRFYDVALPYRVSGFLVGIGISKFKQIGV